MRPVRTMILGRQDARVNEALQLHQQQQVVRDCRHDPILQQKGNLLEVSMKGTQVSYRGHTD
jgi:hypothetical protein